MNELLGLFHIDWRLLIAQLLNFGLVLVVLYFLLWKPLSKMIAERTATIAEGIEKAEFSEALLFQAKKDARSLEESALHEANELKQRTIEESKRMLKVAHDEHKEIKANLFLQAQIEAKQYGESVIKEVRGEAVDLVLSVSSSVLARELSDPLQSRQFVESLLAQNNT